MASNGALRRDGGTLAASGVFDRAAATQLWQQVDDLLPGAAALDLSAIERLDSAGLALLAEVAARLRQQHGDAVTVAGTPPGLEELRAAYRLSPALDFQA